MVRLISIEQRTGGCRNSGPVWIMSHSWVIMRKITSSESLPFARACFTPAVLSSMVSGAAKSTSLTWELVRRTNSQDALSCSTGGGVGGMGPRNLCLDKPSLYSLTCTQTQQPLIYKMGWLKLNQPFRAHSLILIFYDCLSWQRATC